MNVEVKVMEQIRIVSRNAIPPITSVEQDGEYHDLGELRDFRWNDQLKEFMPDESRFSVSWVRLAHGEVLKEHVHPIQSMMVFYAGSGQMIGDLSRTVAKEDVVVVPPGCQHGFIGGPDGLFALSIQLGEGFYTKPEKPRVTFSGDDTTLPTVLAYAERRLKEFELGPLFELVERGAMEDERRCRAFQGAMKLWSEAIWSALFAQLASTVDARRRSLYLKDLFERMSRSRIADPLGPAARRGPAANATGGEPRLRDPLLEASMNWFSYQMYVLDDAEKSAIVHLVIEPATEALARQAGRLVDAQHLPQAGNTRELLEAVLQRQAPKTYGRVREVVDEAWNMIEAITDRIADLTRRD